jgi:hypothetical protein
MKPAQPPKKAVLFLLRNLISRQAEQSRFGAHPRISCLFTHPVDNHSGIAGVGDRFDGGRRWPGIAHSMLKTAISGRALVSITQATIEEARRLAESREIELWSGASIVATLDHKPE